MMNSLENKINTIKKISFKNTPFNKYKIFAVIYKYFLYLNI